MPKKLGEVLQLTVEFQLLLFLQKKNDPPHTKAKPSNRSPEVRSILGASLLSILYTPIFYKIYRPVSCEI